MNNLILLIEDNSDDIMLIQRAVKKHPLKPGLKIFKTGLEALDFLFSINQYINRPPHDEPDIIIMDLMLPHMNGFRVLEEIRSKKNFKKIPVIIFTSSNVEKDINKCFRLGANSFVQKPIDYSEYNKTIDTLVDYWFRINLNPRA